MARARKVSVLVVAASCAAVAMTIFLSPAWAEAPFRPTPAPVPEEVPPAPENTTECNYQKAQDFMIRANFVLRGRLTKEERQERTKIHEKTIEYRTKEYGYFKGFGKRSWNEATAAKNTEQTTFMGLKVRLNKRIIPALQCVEAQIREHCGDVPYEPMRLSGLRDKNTFHNSEVSNHVYGIGLDVDPTKNTCCGCVARWAEHPLCKRPVKSIYDRMAMPECWVHAFERFGFYWLGRDRLQDTMHFEFLGDPDQIERTEPEAIPDGGATANNQDADAPGPESSDNSEPNQGAAPEAEGQAPEAEPEPSPSACGCRAARSRPTAWSILSSLL